MAYRIELTGGARKDLAALPREVQIRISAALEILKTNPRPRGAKKLKKKGSMWRIRVGEYRILYTIDDSALLITIARIRHRKDAYD